MMLVDRWEVLYLKWRKIVLMPLLLRALIFVYIYSYQCDVKFVYLWVGSRRSLNTHASTTYTKPTSRMNCVTM
jgi:hypothetical protein